jgi:protein-disulfide isomerase
VTVSRRAFVTSSFAIASIAGVLPLAGCGDDANAVDVKELMKPGPLPEKTLGKADAPVTVVEYSSLGCPHCAAFEVEVFPHLKQAYIDTGKVYYVSREFPLDQVAAAAAMLARCAPDDKFFEMVNLFFTTQDRWHVSTNSVDALFNLVKQAGFTRESFEACLKDQKLLDGITAVRSRAADVFHVDATPAFFVNGKKSEHFQSIAEVDKTISGLIGS